VTKHSLSHPEIQQAKDKSSLKVYHNSLDHLMDELARINFIVRSHVEKWRSHGKTLEFLGLYISEEEVDSLLNEETTYSEDLIEIRNLEREIAERKEAATRKGVELRLEMLRSLFSLSSFEIDALLVVLASELDLKYRKLFAYLQDDVTKKKPTVGLILSLFCKSKGEAMEARKHFGYDAPLLKNMVFHLEDGDAPLLEKGVKLDEKILSFLLGKDELDSNIASFVSLINPARGFDELALPETLKAQLSTFSELNADLKPLFLLHGSYGQLEVAEALCAKVDSPLLVADLERLKSETVEVTVRLLLREAKLQGAAVYLDGFDAAGEETKRILLGEIEKHEGAVFVPSRTEFSLNKKTIKVEVPRPNYLARVRMWRFLLGEFEGVEELAARFRFGRNKAVAALEAARNKALFRDPTDTSLTFDDLYEGCRAQSSSIPFTVKITQRYTWEDIVLSVDKKEQLREVCNYVKHCAKVYEIWGFEKHSLGKGLNVLFSGPSGTGKTMAAEIVARELMLDIYKIDLSMVVSKYIGETEKNLNRIFKEAEECNVILFFDEADAIFGRRTEVRDAHDRYANIEINYLLQKMEEHEGIVILATNMSKNIDAAFLRRMNFIVEFPFPNEEYRLTIWKKVFPEQTPLDEIDFDFLAKLQISGGNIKNIAVTAAFLAAENSENVKMKHIVKAARREFQKIGKIYGKEEFGRYYDPVE
jgi:SpoVK/Ycf46/Vps4 family AAA+-type ATPase